MIRSNQELYKAINEIRRLLKEKGGEVYEQKLYNALCVSSVVTEIFVTLKSVLNEIKKTAYFQDEKIGPLVQECKDVILQALVNAGGWREAPDE
ncbi:MAG: hypothetical protein V4496_06750 [Pseudomonadota bacterium]